MIKFSILVLYFSIFHANVSFAYLDPGTGSIILQTIIALLAAGMATISIWWQKVKNIFYKIFKKK
tara:strand:- start:339 stop:533 length:195 start_codon:yes stop_codon:yes gene_type:complete